MELKPQIDVGVLIWKDSKILLGKRKSPFGKGFYSLPGGHLEFCEHLKECAKREAEEETGLIIDHIWNCGYTEDIIDGKHYLTMYFTAGSHTGTLENKEPEKCEGWEWYAADALPDPLWKPVKEILERVAWFKFKR